MTGSGLLKVAWCDRWASGTQLVGPIFLPFPDIFRVANLRTSSKRLSGAMSGNVVSCEDARTGVRMKCCQQVLLLPGRRDIF
jgi:hypothetical protein